VTEESRDAKDLAEFAASGCAEAFARLSSRYAGMVYRVCLRRLGSEADAEDASQAVFLALARKAGSVRPARLASWLHGAARRAAQFAARSRANRARYEREAAEVKSTQKSTQEAPAREALAHLDAEVARLPARMREVVARHYLAGLSRAELARELGVPEGTVQSRLNAGLEKLRARMARRGAGLGAAGLGALLSSEAAAGAPAALIASLPALVTGTAATGAAVGAGAGLSGAALGAKPGVSLIAEGIIKAMFWTKMKIAAAVVTVACAAGVAVPVADKYVRAAEPMNHMGAVETARPELEPDPEPLGAAAAPARAPAAPLPLPKGVREIAAMTTGRTLQLMPSPDGSKLVLLQEIRGKKAVETMHAFLIDAGSGKTSELCRFSGKVDTLGLGRMKLLWASNGSKLLVASALDRKLVITVFDKAGKQQARYPAGRIPKGRLGDAFTLLPSPDGRLLALFGRSLPRVRFLSWDGVSKGSAELGEVGVSEAAWTPDSRTLRVMLYEPVKNPKTKKVGQWRVNAVRSVSVAGGKVEVVKGTRLKEDKLGVLALGSNGLHVMLSTAFALPGKGKYHLLDMSTGGKVEIDAAKLGCVPKRFGPKFASPCGVDGFVAPGPDGVLRFVNNEGKITEIHRGKSSATRARGFSRFPNPNGHIGGDRMAFTVGTDLYVARLGTAKSARLVARGWLVKRTFKARPAKGQMKARPARTSYYGRTMYDQVVFCRTGKRLFGVLNIAGGKGGRLVEIKIGK